MKLKLTWLMTLFMAFVMQFSFGQEKTVTGTITDNAGIPLAGVNVIVKNTSRGVQSDFDGNYSIKANVGEILVYSFVSMETQEIVVGAGDVYNITMSEDVAALDEVVVVGYKTTTKTKSSVAQVSISSETIENRPNASFVQTLSGQVPGLNITTNSGQPGGNSIVNLRGVGSINGNTEPLFIIDGAPVDEDNFRSLNPQDIAKIDILKDAGATAIYGNRGANGVIIIETRQGTFGQGLKVNYNGFVSFNTLPDDDYNRMTSQELLRYERQRGAGAGAGISQSKFNPGEGTPLTDAQIDNAPNFNWSDFFFRTAMTQSHTLSLASGGENSAQFTSFGFQDTEGILVNSDLKRFNIRSNVNGKSSNDKFRYGSNITVNYSTSGEPNAIGTGGINQNYVLGALQAVPYITPDDYINGADLTSPLSFTNTPLFLLDKIDGEPRIEEEIKFVGSVNANYSIFDWLVAGVVLSGDYQNEIFTLTRKPDSFNAILFGGAANPTAGFQQQQTRREFSYNQVTSLNFSETWGKHTFDLGLYTEYFKAHLRTFGYNANGLDPKTVAVGDGSGFIEDNADNDLFIDTANANQINAGLFSYFASLDYDFDEKYGLSGTIRRDASYRFAQSNRYATFWSIAGRWNISNEAFMEGSVFDVLKLRGSYGTAGNQDIVGLGYFSAPDLTLDLFTTTPGYGNQNSIALAQLGNRDLRWETVATANIGLDWEMFNRRFRGSVDVYERQTTDLFQSTPLSAATGFTSLQANTGELFNRGVDFDLKYDVVRATTEGGLNVRLGIVGNFNETELKDIPNPDGEIIGLGREGGILREYFSLRYVGVNPANGELLYLTADGNVTEQPDADNDRVWLGKNIYPDWNGGFTTNIDFKGFYFTTQWNYIIGVDRFDFDYFSTINPDNVGQFNSSTDILRAWQQPGDITDIPSWTAANRNSFGSDRFITSADFLRLRFASLGYNVPSKYLENTGVDNLSIFVNGENIITISEWRGFDPEAQTNTSRQYPTPRTISVGFELGF